MSGFTRVCYEFAEDMKYKLVSFQANVMFHKNVTVFMNDFSQFVDN
jgi:hypothetical protein